MRKEASVFIDKILYLQLIITIGWIVSGCAFKGHSGLEIGKPAPEFNLKNLEGQEVNLKDYRGKVVLLNFWATWCPPCVGELVDLQQIYEEYKDQGLVIIGLNMDSDPSKVKKIVEAKRVTFPILLADIETAKMYKVSPIPALFLLDRKGILRWQSVGYQGRMSIEKELWKMGLIASYLKPPEKSLLVMNFKGNKERLGFIFSRILAHRLHYAPRELIYQPCDEDLFRVLKEAKHPKDYVPSFEESERMAERLGVANILTGELIVEGENVAIKAKLSRVAEKDKDIYISLDNSVQALPNMLTDLALKIVQSPGINLSKEGREAIKEPHVKSLQNFALAGRTILSENAREDIANLKEVIKEDPRFDFAYIQLIKELFEIKDYPAAIAVAKKAKDVFPNHSHFRLLYALALQNNKENEKARDELIKLIHHDPDYIHAHHNLAHLNSDLKRHKEAVIEAERALKLNPASAESHLCLADIYSSWAYTTRAGRYFKKMNDEEKEIFRKGMDKALSEAEIAISIDPDYYAAYLHLIGDYIEHGMIAKAEESFEKAVQLEPESLEPYEELVWAYYSGYSNQPEKVDKLCERAIKEHPENPDAYLFYANRLLGRLGSTLLFDEAKIRDQSYGLEGTWEWPRHSVNKEKYIKRILNLANQAIKKSEGPNVDARQIIAEIYTIQMKFKEAIEEAKAILKIDPNHFLTLRTLADAYLSLRDWKNGQAVLEKTLRVKPDSVTARWYLGLAYYYQGKKEKARECFSYLAEKKWPGQERAQRMLEYVK